MVLGIAGLMLLLVHQRMGTVLHYLALRAASAVGRPGILPQALQTQKGLPYALAIAPAGLVLAARIAVDLTPREAAMDSFAAATDPRPRRRPFWNRRDRPRRDPPSTGCHDRAQVAGLEDLRQSGTGNESGRAGGDRRGGNRARQVDAMLNVLIHWLETHTDQTFVLFSYEIPADAVAIKLVSQLSRRHGRLGASYQEGEGVAADRRGAGRRSGATGGAGGMPSPGCRRCRIGCG